MIVGILFLFWVNKYTIFIMNSFLYFPHSNYLANFLAHLTLTVKVIPTKMKALKALWSFHSLKYFDNIIDVVDITSRKI